MSDSVPSSVTLEIIVFAEPLFPLGGLVATPGALAAIPRKEIENALARHQSGDWGEMDAEDLAANNQALAHGGRLFSAYSSARGQRFWIITEADRSVTTILFPSEY